MGAGLYHPRGCKFGRWPPVLPVQSQLGREGLGAQTFPLQPPRWTFRTNPSICHCPLLLFLRVGQPGPLRRLASHLCLQKPVSRPGWRWMFSHLNRRWMFPASIGGGLASVLIPSRGSSCRGPSLGQPPWVRSSAWLGYGSIRYRVPLEVWAGVKLAQL